MTLEGSSGNRVPRILSLVAGSAYGRAAGRLLESSDEEDGDDGDNDDDDIMADYRGAGLFVRCLL